MNKPPPWEVMHDASMLDPFATSRESYAAEIRALRDWLVPEDDNDDGFAVIPQGERQRLRTLLTAEADRAEHS